jgi:hypothetical protein
VDEVHGTTIVGVDGWRHPFRMLKHAGTPDFRVARLGSSESTAGTIRSLDFVQGHPCVSCRVLGIVGVGYQGCPQVSTCGTAIVGVDSYVIRSADCV